MEQKYLFIGIILVLAVSGYGLFVDNGFTENGYAELTLVKEITGIQLQDAVVRGLIVAITAASAILLFFMKRESEYGSFLAAVFFILSPFVFSTMAYAASFGGSMTILLLMVAGFVFFRTGNPIKLAAIIPLTAALYVGLAITGTEFSVLKIKEIGIVLPLSILSVVPLVRGTVSSREIFFIAGLALSPFLPAFAIAFLAISLIDSLPQFIEKNGAFEWALLAFALFFYFILNPALGNYISAAGIGVALGMITYFIASLFTTSSPQLTRALIIFSIALAVTDGLLATEQLKGSVPTTEELELITDAPDGTIGMLEHTKAFEYYNGQKPRLITAKELLGTDPLSAEYAIITVKGLERTLAPRPIVFRPVQASVQDSSYIVDYYSNNYVLRTAMTQEFEIITDATIQDLTGRSPVRTVSLPRLRKFGTFENDEFPAIINTENILDTNAYELLFVNEPHLENSAGKIIRTR